MTRLWRRLLERLVPAPNPSPWHEPVPAVPAVPPGPPGVAPTPAARAVPPPPPDHALPRTYRPAAPDDGFGRPRLFDPSLRQFPSAFRAGDPPFSDAATGRRWADTRRRVTDHVLRRIAESPSGDNLILRGSRLLRAWLGDAAREPGDLDWVADPPALQPSAAPARRMFDGLIAAVLAPPGPAGVELVPGRVAVDDIWTYERVPGQRVVFPWRADGLPGGAVQVDVVFGEDLVEPDRRVAVRAADGGCVSIRAAGPAQSLAWKLLWLATDFGPQGKDLYDAVLLAEKFFLPRTVLERTLLQGGARPLPGTASAFVVAWAPVDWANFRAEFPGVGGEPADWLARLAAALGPTFAQPGWDSSSPPPAAPDPRWRSRTVVALATGIDADRAFDRLPILADALEDAGCDDADLLAHCRGNGPHSGGCWVVDLILGERKESV